MEVTFLLVVGVGFPFVILAAAVGSWRLFGEYATALVAAVSRRTLEPFRQMAIADQATRLARAGGWVARGDSGAWRDPGEGAEFAFWVGADARQVEVRVPGAPAWVGGARIVGDRPAELALGGVSIPVGALFDGDLAQAVQVHVLQNGFVADGWVGRVLADPSDDQVQTAREEVRALRDALAREGADPVPGLRTRAVADPNPLVRLHALRARVALRAPRDAVTPALADRDPGVRLAAAAALRDAPVARGLVERPTQWSRACAWPDLPDIDDEAGTARAAFVVRVTRLLRETLRDPAWEPLLVDAVERWEIAPPPLYQELADHGGDVTLEAATRWLASPVAGRAYFGAAVLRRVRERRGLSQSGEVTLLAVPEAGRVDLAPTPTGSVAIVPEPGAPDPARPPERPQ